MPNESDEPKKKRRTSLEHDGEEGNDDGKEEATGDDGGSRGRGSFSDGPTSIVVTDGSSGAEVPYEKQTALYRLIGSRSFGDVEERLGTNPEEALVWVVTRWANSKAGTTVWYRRLPLHHLAERKPDGPSLVRALIAAHPDAITAPDEHGRVPLVHACIRGASVEVVRELLGPNVEDGGDGGTEAGGGGEGKEDGDGNDEGADAMAAAAAPDNDGRLALHWACEYSSSPAVVSTVLGANPTAVRRADGYGRLPLHWECLNLREDAGVVSRLIEAYPDGVGVRDADGRTPLDLAAENVTSRDRKEIMKILREAGGGTDSSDATEKKGEGGEGEGEADAGGE